MVEYRFPWTTYCRMGMVHLTTRSVLHCRPQHSNHVMEETPARTSSRVLDAGAHHRESLQRHMERCLHWIELQCIQRTRGWFNSPVDTRRRADRGAFGWRRRLGM